MDPSRRDVLRTTSTAAAAALLGVRCGGGRSPAPVEAVNASATSASSLDVSLRALRGQTVLDPVGGRPAEVWRFEGTRSKGPADALTTSGGYLGPTIRVRPGQRVRVRFENGIGEPSIVHWHGLDVPAASDGHPMHAVQSGASYQYDFEVTSRPGMYWYHPHPHERTGAQVYAGLAGLFLVVDDEDESRGLPTGPYDLPLVIQDRLLDAAGQLVYSPNMMLGFLGDQIFVNGRPRPTLEVKAGSYRLRLLNGSNSRIYKLAWSDGSPMIAIGSDGGLLERAVQKPYVMIAPGERVEVWVDFGRSPGGEDVWLESRSFEGAVGGMAGMGPGMMRGMGRGRGSGIMGPGNGLPNGAAFPVCRFKVNGSGAHRHLPEVLAPVHFRPEGEVVNRSEPRRFEVSMMMMRWLLNGRSFHMTEVAPNERIRLGTTEDWEFSNPGGMMSMPHPIHLHGGQFQVLGRSIAAWGRAAAETVSEGRVEEGWKDTFLLMPGERVRVRVRFERHAGLFLYHCHNLEHEDNGMMRNFLVEA
jgi:blue copper oxidase